MIRHVPHINPELHPRHAIQPKAFGVLSVVAILLAVSIVAYLAIDIRNGRSYQFDEWLLLSLHDHIDPTKPIGPEWFRRFARDLTGMGGRGVLLLITGFAVWFFVIQKQFAVAIYVAFCIGSGAVLTEILKIFVARPRPEAFLDNLIAYSPSFPSGHAMLSAIVFFTLGGFVARQYEEYPIKASILSGATLLTGLIGFSRVYLGIHWPTDVLAGWIAGGAWALMSVRLFRLIRLAR